jgi:prepilin-type N-terminal cleavage/methylation domain-containing protein
MFRRARGGGDAGLTLVELMVTLVVASLVAASTYVFFTGQQRLYDTQTKLLNVQQSVTAAMEMLTRYVRVAGAGMTGCVRISTGPLDPGDPPPVSASTALGNAPATGLRAYLNGTGVVRIPPVWIVDGVAGGPDTLTIAFGNGSFGNWFDAPLRDPIAADTPTAALTVIDPVLPATVPYTSLFRVNDFAVLLDVAATVNRPGLLNDRGCTLYQVTGITPSNTLAHANTSPWNPAGNVVGMMPFGYTTGTTTGTGSALRHFGTLNWVRFAIRPAAGTAPPALTMQRLDLGTAAQVLADGIEDLQVAYACDLNNDGDLAEGPAKTTDEWQLNANLEIPPAVNCYRPAAIRLTLIARSLTPDSLLLSVTSNVKPAAENGAAGATNDQFRHRVLTTTVFPRNLN